MSAPTRHRTGARALALLAALALCACPDDKPKADDPLIQKLKAEQERLAKEGNPPSGMPHGPPTAPEPNPLAQAVAKNEAPKDLPLPGEAIATVGKEGATVQLTGLTKAQTVKGEKMSLTAEGTFLAVKLTLSAGKTVTTFDLPHCLLMPQKGDEIAIARDAQALSGNKLAVTPLESGAQKQVTLYFEVPPEALGPGLRLKVPATPEPVMMGLIP